MDAGARPTKFALANSVVFGKVLRQRKNTSEIQLPTDLSNSHFYFNHQAPFPGKTP